MNLFRIPESEPTDFVGIPRAFELGVLGLGSNCGNRIASLRNAIQKLKCPKISPQIEVLSVSPIYESEALLPESAPTDWNQPFLNTNVLCQFAMPPQELLFHVKSIERSLGRKMSGRWAPREIDIDILTYGNQIYKSQNLTIPHPSLMDRPFAMLPLADLYPQWASPVPGPFLGIPISQVVSHWRQKPIDPVPFKTHRSSLTLTQLVGILNITPDSFSDGNLHRTPEAALLQAQKMMGQGVSILDIGAESTRPGARRIDPQEEWSRLEPVLKALHASVLSDPYHPVTLSVDTRHPETAVKAIQWGAHWINDVTGFSDLANHLKMRKVIVDSDAQLVVMHSLSIPPTQDVTLSTEKDSLESLLIWGEKRIQELNRWGIARDRIILDPGIGFNKTLEQNWEILRNSRRLQTLGVKILIGHSRKSFLNLITDKAFSERDIETAALTVDLASQGIDFLRVHHPDFNVRALKAWNQINGITQCSQNLILR